MPISSAPRRLSNLSRSSSVGRSIILCTVYIEIPTVQRRFLVADEVGLGKTMVARGAVACTIEDLWDIVDRIDVLYICSNQAIASQNINRLNVLGEQAFALPTRMTLLPLQLVGEHGLGANKVNFISLTPGTTFNLRSSTGVVQERALLFHLLKDMVEPQLGLENLLQVGAGTENWRIGNRRHPV